jgi:AcrR family transcriptional regulator
METLGTKQRLIEKAIDLFSKKGFTKASIRDLVKSVKLTNSVVYNYFKNKDHLLYEVIERMGNQYFKKMEHVFSEDDDPMNRLRKMIFQQTCLTMAEKKGVKIFFDDVNQLSPKFKGKILDQQRQMYGLFKNEISELERLGLLRPVDITVATFCCFAMINWSYRWYKKEGNLSVEQIADDIIDVFFNGILNTRGSLRMKKLSEDRQKMRKS